MSERRRHLHVSVPVLAWAALPALTWASRRRGHDPTPLALDGPERETPEELCAELGCLPPTHEHPELVAAG